VGAVARALLVAATVALLHGCTSGGDDRVEVDAPTPAAADREACRTLHESLPDRVADQESRKVAPDTDWTAAWGDPAIVLSCGGPPPEGFTRTSTCTTVNGVDWFIPEEQLDAEEPVELTMTTVNRATVVQVTLPPEYWPPATVLADLSDVVRKSTDKTGTCV
jgi:hypothetical protein